MPNIKTRICKRGHEAIYGQTCKLCKQQTNEASNKARRDKEGMTRSPEQMAFLERRRSREKTRLKEWAASVARKLLGVVAELVPAPPSPDEYGHANQYGYATKKNIMDGQP